MTPTRLPGRLALVVSLLAGCTRSDATPSDEPAPLEDDEPADDEPADDGASGRGGGSPVGRADAASADSAGSSPDASADVAGTSRSPDASSPDGAPEAGRLVFLVSGLHLRRVISWDGGKTWTGDTTTRLPGCIDLGDDGSNCDATAAAIGAGVFLVGSAQSVITSRDGKSWKQVDGVFTYPIDVHYLSAAAGGGRLVVGTKTKAVSTTDGETWTTTSVKSAGNWRMTYGNGRFVGVEVKTITSVDGLTWSSKGFGLLLLGVAAGDGMFMAVGDPGYTTSKDGLDWTAPKPVRDTGGGFSAVGFLDGRWLACGSGPEGCWASLDGGQTWKSHSPQPLRWLVVAEGRYFGVNGTSVYSSKDGATWDVVYRAQGEPFARITVGRI